MFQMFVLCNRRLKYFLGFQLFISVLFTMVQLFEFARDVYLFFRILTVYAWQQISE